METIFDHNVTQQEAAECGFLDDWQIIRHGIKFTIPITRESYIKDIDQNAANLDLGILMMHRKENKLSKKYFSKVPIKSEEYLLGFDNQQVSVISEIE